MTTWIDEELATVDLGDKRLDKRMGIILDRYAAKPTASNPQAFRGGAELQGAYRFFNNVSVTPEAVLAPHRDATIRRIREHAVALLAQDTSEVDCTRKEEVVKDSGPLTYEARSGFLLHPVIAFTPERLPLGTINAKVWARDPKDPHKKEERKQKPFEDKESYRWFEGYRHACDVAASCPDTKIVGLSDREGDIYECLMDGQPDPDKQKAEWIIRSCQNRSLAKSSGDYDDITHDGIREAVAARPVLGQVTVKLPKRDKRKAREATLQIQSKRVWIRAPYRKGKRLADVPVNAVLVSEVNTPEGEEPVEWLLLTSLPVATFDEAYLVVRYYCCRWSIEIFFRVLKSGCKVEKSQLETADRLIPCVMIYMIVAWRTMMVTMLGRECPEMPCDVLFEEDEWRSVYTIVTKEPAPLQPPPLGEFVPMLASLGGYLGRKGDGPPGPQTVWIGLQRMTDFALAWQAFGPRKT